MSVTCAPVPAYPPTVTATTSSPPPVAEELVLDIEHIPVEDDPRNWSKARKNFSLALIASGSLIAGFATNIQNPAIQDMQKDLPATSSQISLSVSLFILMQGSAPLLWCAISEVKGRKFVYLSSLSIFVAGSVVVATSTSIGSVIGMRILQAAGSSAVMSIGAASLADIFEPAERGTKMGIYYIAPLLGPSLGPIFGGVLTKYFNWRGPFWFLAILAGIILLGFLCFFKDTFRKERSATYQSLLRKKIKEHAEKLAAASKEADTIKDDASAKPDAPKDNTNTKPATVLQATESSSRDLEKQESLPSVEALVHHPDIKMSFKDVAPLKPLWLVLRRWNNILMLFASGLLFSFSFVVMFTTSRTLGSAYGYDALHIGLVLLSFGLGNVGGSVLGGRWSDIQLIRLQKKNGGKMYAEMRLHSTIYAIWLFPLSVVGFAWVCQERVHVSALCVMLFISGFLVISVYASTLAYIVDANVGRSSSAVALNSFFRGMAACLGTEIAVPIQDKLGDGWMYTLFAIVLLTGSGAIHLTMTKGEKWRTHGETTEKKS